MRRWILIGSLAGLLTLGCEDNQPPRVSRGDTKRLERTRTGEPQKGSFSQGSSEEAEPSPYEEDGTVHFGALTLTVPEGWERQPAQSSFLKAEFKLPGASGEADGRLTLSEAGGSIEANIERWKGQFTSPLENSKQEQIDVGRFKVTLVDFTGEFNDQRGPYAPAARRSGYRMISAIIPIEGQLHFIKSVGPKKTMEAHAEKIRAFLRSMKSNGPA
jgi:hypothetical protein